MEFHCVVCVCSAFLFLGSLEAVCSLILSGTRIRLQKKSEVKTNACKYIRFLCVLYWFKHLFCMYLPREAFLKALEGHFAAAFSSEALYTLAGA